MASGLEIRIDNPDSLSIVNPDGTQNATATGQIVDGSDVKVSGQFTDARKRSVPTDPNSPWTQFIDGAEAFCYCQDVPPQPFTLPYPTPGTPRLQLGYSTIGLTGQDTKDSGFLGSVHTTSPGSEKRGARPDGSWRSWVRVNGLLNNMIAVTKEVGIDLVAATSEPQPGQPGGQPGAPK